MLLSPSQGYRAAKPPLTSQLYSEVCPWGEDPGMVGILWRHWALHDREMDHYSAFCPGPDTATSHTSRGKQPGGPGAEEWVTKPAGSAEEKWPHGLSEGREMGKARG